jgi:hypothetical protein
MSELLHWLKSGNRPHDPWVANAMLQRIGRFVNGENTRVYLSLFDSMPGRQDNLTLLNEVEDVQALPLLQYWESLPGAAIGKQQLQSNIERLEGREKRAETSACCEPTEACLRQHVTQGMEPNRIANEEQAHHWLSTPPGGTGTVQLRYTDGLQRSAEVEEKGGRGQTWEFLYSCWRRTDAAAPSASK